MPESVSTSDLHPLFRGVAQTLEYLSFLFLKKLTLIVNIFLIIARSMEYDINYQFFKNVYL